MKNITDISLVVDYGVFRRIKAEAQELGLSINSYIVQCSDPLGPLSRLESSKLDMAAGLGRIESKLDELLNPQDKTGQAYEEIESYNKVLGR